MSGMDNHQAGMGTMGEFKTPEMEGDPGLYDSSTLPRRDVG